MENRKNLRSEKIVYVVSFLFIFIFLTFVVSAAGGTHTSDEVEGTWSKMGTSLYFIVGKVGIGINLGTALAEKLEVSGNIKVMGAGNGIIFPDGSKKTTAGHSLFFCPPAQFALNYDEGRNIISDAGNFFHKGCEPTSDPNVVLIKEPRFCRNRNSNCGYFNAEKAGGNSNYAGQLCAFMGYKGIKDFTSISNSNQVFNYVIERRTINGVSYPMLKAAILPLLIKDIECSIL